MFPESYVVKKYLGRMRIKVIELWLLDAAIERQETWQRPDQSRDAEIQICCRLEDEQLAQTTVRAPMQDAFAWLNRAIWFFSKGELEYETESGQFFVRIIYENGDFRSHKRMMENPRADQDDEPCF